MEIKVTRLIEETEPFNFSASIAERGPNAGQVTWAAAKEEAGAHPILTTDEAIESAKSFFSRFGAWSKEEIAAWSAQETNALTIQYVSGDLREAESVTPGDGLGGVDWDAYEKLSQEGQVSGRLFVTGSDAYFTLYE